MDMRTAPPTYPTVGTVSAWNAFGNSEENIESGVNITPNHPNKLPNGLAFKGKYFGLYRPGGGGGDKSKYPKTRKKQRFPILLFSTKKRGRNKEFWPKYLPPLALLQMKTMKKKKIHKISK